MSFEAWLVSGVVVACVVIMASGRLSPDLALAGGLTLLVVLGVVTPVEALAGLANPGLVTVALMYVVAAGVRDTGGVDFLARRVLGRPRGYRRALLRLMVPTAAVSAFINNTPVVATLLPAVNSWAKRIGVNPSRLLLPLSYAAILGGTCTLIGTSTNLVVHGLLEARTGTGIGLFELAWVGVPVTIAGLAWCVLAAPRLLPDRQPAEAAFANPREYTLEMQVEEGGPLVGRSVEEAGLRHLKGLYLVEIDRQGTVIPAVGPRERLQAGDRLVFVGSTDSVLELQQMKGLVPSADRSFTLEDREHPERLLVEVVVSPRCALIGKTIREGRFRMVYGASVVAIARGGQRIRGKLGDVRLQPSDTLLLEVRPPFLERHRNSGDFLLISEVPDFVPPRHERAWLAWSVLGLVVLTTTSGLLPVAGAAMLGAAAMLMTRCCTVAAARRSLDGQVLIAIAAALGLGQAMESTGAAAAVAQGFLALGDGTPLMALVLVYAVTWVLTEAVTNNAVAALMFPIVYATAGALGADPMPFLITVMVAASASFATPMGYQTNLMVYGPGGYRYGDYLRFGLPLNLMVAAVALTVIPRVWPP